MNDSSVSSDSSDSTDPVLIGIDAGTSVIKAVAFDAAGDTLATASRVNRYDTLDDGGVEQDMARTADDTFDVLAELVAANPALARRVVGLAVTGQGDGTWLVDRDGNAVQPAWLWLDSRAAMTACELEASEAHALVYRQSGTGVNVCQMRTHLAWMDHHRPAALDRAETALHCKDWLYRVLTGVTATDPSEAVFTFGNYRTRDYDEAVIEALGLGRHRRLLPPIVDGIDRADPLTTAAARRIGLPAGLPVTLGYIDVVCTALGGGLYAPMVAPGVTILGSTGMHMRWLSDAQSVVLNEAESGYTMCVPGGSYAQMQSNMAATLNIDWLIDIAVDAAAMGGHRIERRDVLAGLDDALASTPPGSTLFHPYISAAGERGPFTDPNARASMIGLDSGVGYRDMMRAVFEGLALAARDCYDAMGAVPPEVRVSGGGARSSMLRGLLAAALDRPVRIADRDEAGAAGACMIAATQLGLYSDLGSCADQWVERRLGEPVAPDPDAVLWFADRLPIYRTSRDALRPVWQQLASQRRTGSR